MGGRFVCAVCVGVCGGDVWLWGGIGVWAEVRACVRYGPCVGGVCMCVQCMRGWGACVCNMVWRVWMCGEGVWMERWRRVGVCGGWGGKDVLVACQWGRCVYCDVHESRCGG